MAQERHVEVRPRVWLCSLLSGGRPLRSVLRDTTGSPAGGGRLLRGLLLRRRGQPSGCGLLLGPVLCKPPLLRRTLCSLQLRTPPGQLLLPVPLLLLASHSLLRQPPLLGGPPGGLLGSPPGRSLRRQLRRLPGFLLGLLRGSPLCHLLLRFAVGHRLGGGLGRQLRFIRDLPLPALQLQAPVRGRSFLLSFAACRSLGLQPPLLRQPLFLGCLQLLLPPLLLQMLPPLLLPGLRQSALLGLTPGLCQPRLLGRLRRPPSCLLLRLGGRHGPLLRKSPGAFLGSSGPGPLLCSPCLLLSHGPGPLLGRGPGALLGPGPLLHECPGPLLGCCGPGALLRGSHGSLPLLLLGMPASGRRRAGSTSGLRQPGLPAGRLSPRVGCPARGSGGRGDLEPLPPLLLLGLPGLKLLLLLLRQLVLPRLVVVVEGVPCDALGGPVTDLSLALGIIHL
mmetsp:Transcript_57133/g.177608  ORF Transcript_57133/g.177608 Transcript_57133/m.177608 type:complete len:449 (-) Transcript_57133:530-1876(-)